MIRAGVDDSHDGARGRNPRLQFVHIVFCLGAGIAGAGGVLGGPILSAYPGLDADMLPLALIVVILGRDWQPAGCVYRQLHHRFIYTFGTGAVSGSWPTSSCSCPMIFVIAFRPQGLFGRVRRMEVIGATLLAASFLLPPFLAGDFYINLASQI